MDAEQQLSMAAPPSVMKQRAHDDNDGRALLVKTQKQDHLSRSTPQTTTTTTIKPKHIHHRTKRKPTAEQLEIAMDIGIYF
jgi:hypothetical protein